MKTIVPVCESTTMLSKYRAMIERKIDVIDMVIGMTHDYEAEAWLSVRMNDHHFFDDPGFNSLFSYKYAEQVGVNHSRTYLDFSKTAVQNYYKAYITELCEKYDIDGIELDFLRSCPIMTNVNEENRQTLNRFVQEIRNIIDQFSEKRGKEIRLSARVYPEEQMNLDYGVDAAQWIADGSISTLVVEGWYIPTYYHIPVHNWRESIDARNTQNYPYSLLCGADWAVRCDSRAKEGYIMWLTLEQLKGFASSAYESGADGIYFFNHFNPNSDAGAITYYIDEDGVNRKVYCRIITGSIRNRTANICPYMSRLFQYALPDCAVRYISFYYQYGQQTGGRILFRCNRIR